LNGGLLKKVRDHECGSRNTQRETETVDIQKVQHEVNQYEEKIVGIFDFVRKHGWK